MRASTFRTFIRHIVPLLGLAACGGVDAEQDSPLPVGVVGDPLIPTAGSNCGGSLCCPEPLNATGGIAPTIFYPAAYANVTSAGGDQLPELSGVAATWGDARTLDVPVALPCPAVLRGTAGCLARHAITLTPTGQSPLSIVVSADASRLAWLSPSTPVRLTLRRLTTTANLAHLEVVRASDGAVVLAVFADALTSNATELTAAGAPLRFARSAAPYCVARLQAPCNRTLAAYALSVTAGSAPVEIAPASSATVGAYLVTSRRWVDRGGNRGNVVQCADYVAPYASFEVVRTAP